MKKNLENEEFYKKILYNSPLGYAYHEIILDNNGNPCDYRFLEVNSAFEKLTGLNRADIIEKNVTEVLPTISEDPSDWISLYGEVALNNENKSFVSFSQPLQRWYNVEAFSLKKNYFITVFTDITDVKLNQQEIEELFKQRNMMFEEHGAIMLMINPDSGKIIDANLSAVKYYGYSKDELLSKTIWDINTLDKETVKSHMKKAKESRQNFFVFSHKLKSGEIRKVAVNSNPVVYKNEKLLYSIIFDVTERELAKEELFRSQLLLKASLNSPKDIIIFSLDKSYNYLYFNDTHKQFMKSAYNANVEVGKYIFNYISNPEDIVKAKKNYDKALNGQAHVTRESYGDINIKTYSTDYNPIKDDEGNIIGVSTYARDVSEIVEAYRNLENEKMTAQKYLDIAGHIMLVLDVQGNIQIINEKGSSILNLEKDEIIGKKWIDYFIPEDDKEEIKDLFETGMNTSNDFNTLDYENQIIDSKGNLKDIVWHNTKLYDVDGNTIGVLCSGEDVTEKNNMLEKLKQNEINLLKSQAIAHLGTWRLDVETNEVVWTEELYKMYGFDPKLPVPNYTEHMKLFKPRSWEKLSAALELTRTQGIPYELELETVTKDGSIGWMWVRGEAEKDNDGKIISIWGAAQDITERKTILEQLKQNEINLLKAQKIAKMGSWRLDAKTNHVEWTDELFRMFGFDPTHPVLDLMEQKKLFTSESWERLSNSIDLSISKGIPYELEVQTVKNNGTIGWMWTQSEIEKNENGEIIAIHGVAQDITERKEQEEILKQSEDRLRASEKNLSMIMANVEEAIYGVDINDKCTFVNESFQDLLGYQEDEVIGKNMHELIHHSHPDGTKYPANECPMEKAFKRGEKVKVDLDYLWKKNGEKIPVEYSSNPLFNGDTLFGAVVTFKDISKNIEHLKELEYLSYHDHLTGLYNHFYLMKVLNSLNTDKYSNLGIILFDIDNLKLLNSNFDISVGDEALLLAAKTIKQHMQDEYMLFRYGGDEFVVLTKDIDEDSLRDLARDIELDFSGKFISGVSMTLSHGVSVRDANAENIEKIIDKAEKDLYRFKSVHMNSTKFTTLKMLLGFLTRKFDYEKRHSEFVGIMTEKVGKQLSLSEFNINELAIAGMFHDIGKLTIPDEILNKPGKLTNEEFDIIKQHPVVGYRIIKDALPYSNMSEYILHHHERYDGKGYPTGLKGNDIPLQSRILCVVDAYEAMTSERVYKKRMSKNEAIVELKRCMGTQFDPQITEAFIDIISIEKEDE